MYVCVFHRGNQTFSASNRLFSSPGAERPIQWKQSESSQPEALAAGSNGPSVAAFVRVVLPLAAGRSDMSEECWFWTESGPFGGVFVFHGVDVVGFL